MTHNQGFLPKYDVWDFKVRSETHRNRQAYLYLRILKSPACEGCRLPPVGQIKMCLATRVYEAVESDSARQVGPFYQAGTIPLLLAPIWLLYSYLQV